ncbi:putative mitogen-activated protein kinase kinase kinase STE-STE11 family [Helianthus annuus]|nr:putative mitogen-activated protein kinase kinase kinase STE-STE11 family [Helianthus annuus]KAJ0830402.1 putative mitogen-activated protein kinase kinase kinase STE-STE11 family [Helianthus annuus]
MHWLYSAFSSSPSSSPSSSSTADDNRINSRCSNRTADVVSTMFSPLRIAGSHHRRHVSGSTNHKHLKENDVVHVRSRSVSTPHTLPMPELSALLKREFRRESAADQKSKYILPSPEEANKKSDENSRDSERPMSLGGLNRFRNTENKESQFQKLPQGYNHGETVSAPTTPISSHAFFLPTNKVDMSPGIQLRSAPEMPSQDMAPGVAYHYHTIPPRSMHDFDGSFVQSPEKRTFGKSLMPSSSPLHKRTSFESPTSRPDSSAQATGTTVHPLPLPPGASGLPPSSPPQIRNRSDVAAKMPKQCQWKKGKLIGCGTFGSVYVGSNRETGALCAMKEVEILPDDPKSAESIKQLQQEIDVLSQLKHPNIVQYYGSEIVEDRFYIYLEYVHPGSINKYVRDHCGGMTESIVRNFTRHIVSGLAYLHSTKTIHRDIKGANLLVDANGVVKLADFGMAKHLDGHVNLSLKGSPYWMAPELLQGKPQKDGSPDLALAVDIWSLGCTIIEMMNGKPPWSEHEGPAAMFKVMKETPPIPKTMSPDGKDFLRCCFIRNPAERPTAIKLLEHKFLMVQNRRARSR